MKKILAAIVAFVLIYVVTTYVRGYFWEKEAASYAREALLEIAKPWNAKKILGRGGRAIQESSLEQIELSAGAFNLSLGDVIDVEGTPKCNLFRGTDVNSRTHKESTYVKCIVTAKFEKQYGVMNITLVDENSQWKLADYYFEKRR